MNDKKMKRIIHDLKTIKAKIKSERHSMNELKRLNDEYEVIRHLDEQNALPYINLDEITNK